MKKVLLTTAPKEALIDPDGLGGNWYDRTDIYMSWTCAVDIEDRLSVSCPPTGLLFLKANVPDVEILQYPTWAEYRAALKSEKWDMVGISFYTWSTPVAIEMAREAREAGVREIWGGNYGAITPGLEAHFTNLVKGPGEFVLHQYVYGRPLQRIHHPPMFGETRFRGITSPVGYLYSKRGCNVGCTFCSTPVFNPVEDAISMAELQEALDAYQERKVAHVVIYDESFLLQNNLGNLVIDGLAQRGLSWDCLTRSDLIHGRIGELTDRQAERCLEVLRPVVQPAKAPEVVEDRVAPPAFQQQIEREKGLDVGCGAPGLILCRGPLPVAAERPERREFVDGTGATHFLKEAAFRLSVRPKSEMLEHSKPRPLGHPLPEPLIRSPPASSGQLVLAHVHELVGDEANPRQKRSGRQLVLSKEDPVVRPDAPGEARLILGEPCLDSSVRHESQLERLLG